MNDKSTISRKPEETWALARELVESLEKKFTLDSISMVLALHGNLGSGKTCFVQGLALALDIHQAVTSPTFTIVNEYKGRLPLYHIDLYRLNSPEESFGFGFEEYLEAKGLVAVEWAERAENLMPDDVIHIYFETMPDAEERKIVIRNFPD